ncbi:prolyl oligopeptidase family serine peptidase [Shewanella abyssi]|uniref:alpha/beta hydrolase family protein n=1 Tax=Shewanella abyssi TaxID=311789 RepID=UPI00201070FE|nr:prolyl oligopeptidase family serine peptidase [Shewanella abyssi]MCL1050188.1 prolyl oligopeptidase family serine peptidase [Shewanella abyssi]
MSRISIFMYSLIALLSTSSIAAEYQVPSQALKQVVEQKKKVSTRLSNNKQWLALLTPKTHKDIESLAKPELKLAGLRLSPTQLVPSRLKTQYLKLELIELSTIELAASAQNSEPVKRTIKLPTTSIAKVEFSPDSQYISFIALTEHGADIYLYNIKKNQTKKLNPSRLNATLGLNYKWLYNSQGLLTNIALNTVPMPETSSDVGPNISVTNAQKAPRRTYQDLLKNAQDDELFNSLTRSQLTLISLEGKTTAIGKPDINISYRVSPNNEYILVKQIAPPFSHVVKYRDFAQDVQLYSLSGVHLKTLAKLESSAFRPSGSDSVRKGPRLIHWRADKAATLAYVMALDKGDSSIKSPFRDQLIELSAPFSHKGVERVKTPWRIANIQWGEDELGLITEKNSAKKQMRVSFFNTQQHAPLKLWYQKAVRDSYKDPGKLVSHKAMIDGQQAGRLFTVENSQLLHYGLGASQKGYQPFLKTLAVDLQSTKAQPLIETSKTLWRSSADKLETIRYVISTEPLKLIINRQTKDTPSHLVFINEQSKSETVIEPAKTGLSTFKGMTRKLITYKRADGLPLSGNLYLPQGYQPSDGPLPVLMWAYPREYKNAEVASQVNYSPNQYSYISPKGPVPFVANGFAVFDRVAMPIIGVGKEKPNDNFRTQLIDNAKAAIDTLVEMGVADRERIAIGGHSYGAFMVANLLAHSDLFAAGIARSGAYNRTLTPFGFQHEKRNFWEAPSLYQQISPFTHADKIDEPLLIMHGEMDSNSGTYPMQSARLFKAIRGLGGQARLVTFPYESHSYKAKQSILHMLWEQEEWLDKHVGHKPSAPETKVSFH